MNNIYFEKYGHGIPIIFLHGWMLNHQTLKQTFEPMFLENEHLSRHFQRIYIDLPGMGKSLIENEYLDNTTYLKQIKDFLKNILPNNSKPILVGHSYGCYISLGIQEELDALGLFLIAPVTIAAPTQRTLPTHSVNLSIDTFYSEEIEFIDFKLNNFILSEKNWLNYSEQILPAIHAANKKFCEYYEAEQYVFPNEDELFFNINPRKTMVVIGKNDYIVGFEDSLSFFQNFTNLEFLLLNNCGHNIQIDKKKCLLYYFKDFLSSNFKTNI